MRRQAVEYLQRHAEMRRKAVEYLQRHALWRKDENTSCCCWLSSKTRRDEKISCWISSKTRIVTKRWGYKLLLLSIFKDTQRWEDKLLNIFKDTHCDEKMRKQAVEYLQDGNWLRRDEKKSCWESNTGRTTTGHTTGIVKSNTGRTTGIYRGRSFRSDRSRRCRGRPRCPTGWQTAPSWLLQVWNRKWEHSFVHIPQRPLVPYVEKGLAVVKCIEIGDKHHVMVRERNITKRVLEICNERHVMWLSGVSTTETNITSRSVNEMSQKGCWGYIMVNRKVPVDKCIAKGY